MRVEMSFETPVIHTRPRTVAARVKLVALFLLAAVRLVVVIEMRSVEIVLEIMIVFIAKFWISSVNVEAWWLEYWWWRLLMVWSVIVPVVVRHPTGVLWRLSADFVDVVRVVPMHPEEVFLDVVSSIELFLTNVTLEWFFVFVDIFVPCEKISAISGVWTKSTAVAFISLRRLKLLLALHFGLQILKKFRHFLQNGILFPQRTVCVLFVVLSSQMHPHATRPRTCIRTARTLKHPEVRVRP